MAKRMRFGDREHRETHGEIRTSPGMLAELRKWEKSILAELPEGYVSAVTLNTRVGPERTRARLGIWTDTGAAVRDNADNDTLTRALARRIR